MSRKIVFIILISIIVIIGVFTNLDSPEKEVNKVILEVRDNKEINTLEIDNIEKVRSFFLYTKEKNLADPDVSIKEISGTGNTKEVVVSLTSINYDSNNNVTEVHSGSLLFILEKESLFDWKVKNIKVLQPMSKDTV